MTPVLQCLGLCCVNRKEKKKKKRSVDGIIEYPELKLTGLL